MILRIRVLAAFVLLAMLWQPAAYGGNGASGGGGAVVCRDSGNQIISAHLYDLFESGYTYHNTSQSAREQLVAAIDRLKDFPFAQGYLKVRFSQVIGVTHFLSPGEVFEEPSDMGAGFGVIQPTTPGCKIEGVAHYNEDNTLSISGDIYKKFTDTDRAALFLHEVIYKIAREKPYPVEDSGSSRHFNERLFANTALPTDLAWAINDLGLSVLGATGYDVEPITLRGPNPQKNIRVEFVADDALKDKSLKWLVTCAPSFGGALNWSSVKGKFQNEVMTPLPNDQCLQVSTLAQGDPDSVWVEADVKVNVYSGSELLKTLGAGDEGIYFAVPDWPVPELPAPN